MTLISGVSRLLGLGLAAAMLVPAGGPPPTAVSPGSDTGLRVRVITLASGENEGPGAGRRWDGSRWSGDGWIGTNGASAGWNGARWGDDPWFKLARPGPGWVGARWSARRWSDQVWR